MKNTEQSKRAAERFRRRKKLARARSNELFSVFKESLTAEENKALEFLYAYIPLCDLTSHDGSYYLDNVRSSLEARKTMPWGEEIPENLFYQFVLFCRVNNENMDDSRPVLYKELKDKVKNLSMKEAVLEINHWCHEKATYRPTDIRTESPLGVIRTAFGRCGEESTLVAAALRSACIPARQVYSPRWAHCDDNHAWVEAWIDGAWRFLGACEPAPDLDMGWFVEPARRAMLIHTKVPGVYTGPEEIVRKSDWYTEINILPRYAETKKITVMVLDDESKPVPNAAVEYKIYNYAHFYSIASQVTSDIGTAVLTTGLGDLLVYAHKGSRFGYKKISVQDVDTVEIMMNRDGADEYTQDFDMAPPPEMPKRPVGVSKEEEEKNKQRLMEEDRIRGEYESTFMNREKAGKLAEETGLNPDHVWKLIETSRGNWKVIADYLHSTAKEYGTLSMTLLDTLFEKDLRDIEGNVLIDHLTNSSGFEGAEGFKDYVLAPRIRNELLVPYRGFFQSRFSKEETRAFREDPVRIFLWIKRNIDIIEEAGGYRNPVTPVGVYELKKSDSLSRDIFFVALCRSTGIPSRLEPAAKNPQYYEGQRWVDVGFDKPGNRDKKIGHVKFDPVKPGTEPEYFPHFTVSRLEKGDYQVLDYEKTGFDVFAGGFPLEAGSYLLVTGNRLDDGKVLSKCVFFTVEQGKTKRVPFEIRMEETAVADLGKIDDKLSFVCPEGRKKISDMCRPNGLIMSWIEPGSEPARHFIRDLELLSERFDKEDVSIVIATEKTGTSSGLSTGIDKALPVKTVFATDEGYRLLEAFRQGLKESVTIDFPAVFVLNYTGSVVYVSTGYRIGLGEQIMKVLDKMSSGKEG
jgi:transglutaminase-like putative cysteine protease